MPTATRYMRKGTSKFRFVPTIASPVAPTVAEITAGTTLEDQMGETNGFEYSNAPINTPDMVSTFTPQIGGEDTAGASSYTFYELNSKTANPVRTALTKGTTGYVVKAPYGFGAGGGSTPAIGDAVETWPVIVTGNNRQWTAANEPARYIISFAITARPQQDALVA